MENIYKMQLQKKYYLKSHYYRNKTYIKSNKMFVYFILLPINYYCLDKIVILPFDKPLY